MVRSPSPYSDSPTRGADDWERILLRDILKSVSRSFYLSLVVLPKIVRQQLGLAYLFCRAADTIADTRILPRDLRLRALYLFRQQFDRDLPALDQVAQLREQLVPYQGSDGERALLHHLPACFHLYRRFSPTDRQLIRELVTTLTQGMEMDLTHFTDAEAQTIRALPDMPDLDRYTYYVAGVVGEFWTKIHLAHLPALRHHDVETLCALGVHFGKGLQMTNILKDLGRDLHIGRCYLPETQLRALHLEPQMLHQPWARHRIEPLLHQLVGDTLAHLDHGCAYIDLLPMRAVRLRLSCMWPLLFALQTLEVVCQADTLLEPQARVKISRQAVYRTMMASLWCVASRRLFIRFYMRLRRRLLTLLDDAKGA
jgi:farnesyl-diphosphate farnesyltransferase